MEADPWSVDGHSWETAFLRPQGWTPAGAITRWDPVKWLCNRWIQITVHQSVLVIWYQPFYKKKKKKNRGGSETNDLNLIWSTLRMKEVNTEINNIKLMFVIHYRSPRHPGNRDPVDDDPVIIRQSSHVWIGSATGIVVGARRKSGRHCLQIGLHCSHLQPHTHKHTHRQSTTALCAITGKVWSDALTVITW